MFFVSRKKILDALLVIKEGYDDSVFETPNGYDTASWQFYRWGNMNCANYIAARMGVNLSNINTVKLAKRKKGKWV